jgi:probable rRNA maturation factor
VATEPRVEVLADEDAGVEDNEALAELICRAAKAALDAEHTAGPDTVTIMLSTDARLRELNLEFNGEDSVTDVLSFNETEGWHNGVPPAELGEDGDAHFLSPGEEPRLGDIAISVEQTARQAAERGIPFEREIAMLAIHGVLHLLGYDHADPEEEKVMFGKTDRVLAGLFGS